MKKLIKKIHFKGLRNNLHFEFFTGMLALLRKLGENIVHISGLIMQLTALVDDEDAALSQVRKYDTTGQIQEDDGKRDAAFYGMRDAIRSALRHFDTGKAEAAQRLNEVFDRYKKTPKLPLPEESAAIHNLLQELEKRNADIELLGLTDWTEQLHRYNESVRSLMAQRDSEAAARSLLRMKEIRSQVDNTYKEITARIEAAAILEGPDTYTELINEINTRVEYYTNLMARGKGEK